MDKGLTTSVGRTGGCGQLWMAGERTVKNGGRVTLNEPVDVTDPFRLLHLTIAGFLYSAHSISQPQAYLVSRVHK